MNSSANIQDYTYHVKTAFICKSALKQNKNISKSYMALRGSSISC